MEIFNIFEQLLADNGRLAKEKVLRENADNELFKRVCYLALNPYIKFYVRKIPDEFEGKHTLTLEAALDLLIDFSERKVTGNTALTALTNIFNSLSVNDAKVLQKIIQKDLKCGVSTSTINKIWPDLIPTYDIQFAESWDEKKAPRENFGIEPKIDGMRVIVECDEKGNVTFNSRSGREIETLDHLKDDLIKLNGGMYGFMFDCEVKTGSFQNTMSVVKRDGKNAKNDDIFLYVFDYMTYDDFKTKKCDKIFSERRKELETKFATNDSPFLILNGLFIPELLPQDDPIKIIVANFKRLHSVGYEGAIVKRLDSIYAFDRTDAWMKVKPTKTIDVEIEGYFEGTGKHKGQLGGFKFTLDGAECRVGGGFKKNERIEFWEIRDEMIGRIIEVEFMELTDGGKTRHCNFIALRDFKGAKS